MSGLAKRLDAILAGIPDAQEPSEDYSKWAGDPVGFCVEVLEEHFTPEVALMMESVRDHEVTVAQSANAVGKTHGAARVAAWFYLCHPGAQVYTAAAPPEGNLRRLLWGEINEVIQRHEKLFESDRVIDLHVERGPKQFLTGVTIPSAGNDAIKEARFSGKHAPYLLFIVDEGDAVPDAVYQGIESCMSGGHVRLLVMFNPRQKAGAVYRKIRDDEASVIRMTAFNHPNVVSGTDEIPGAVTRLVTVRRINEYCRHLGAEADEKREDVFRLPEYLEGCVAYKRNGDAYPPLEAGFYQITEPAASYMMLARYPVTDANQLISTDWIHQARARYDEYVRKYGERPPAGVEATMGLDVADMGDDENVAAFRYGGFVPPLITWSGVDPFQTGLRASKEYKIRRTAKCNVDAIGVGAGVPGHMKSQRCRAYPVKSSESPTYVTELGEFGKLRDQLWWSVREWLRTDASAMLPPDERLIEELTVPTYSTDDGKIRVMKKQVMKDLLKRSPDRADALCLTFGIPKKTYRARTQRTVKA